MPPTWITTNDCKRSSAEIDNKLELTAGNTAYVYPVSIDAGKENTDERNANRETSHSYYDTTQSQPVICRNYHTTMPRASHHVYQSFATFTPCPEILPIPATTASAGLPTRTKVVFLRPTQRYRFMANIAMPPIPPRKTQITIP